MGLDLIIREWTDFKTDANGRNTYKVTELDNLYNCYKILDIFNNSVEFGCGNNASYTFYGEFFYNILEDLNTEKQGVINNPTVYLNSEQRIKEFDEEIKVLEDFIYKNRVQNNCEKDYEIHVSW